jgi:hypothetical protein
MTSPTIKFSAPDTFEGVTEWLITVGNVNAGTLTRERPFRVSRDICRRDARDTAKPWEYSVSVQRESDGEWMASDAIQAGATLREAKKMVAAFLGA